MVQDEKENSTQTRTTAGRHQSSPPESECSRLGPQDPVWEHKDGLPRNLKSTSWHRQNKWIYRYGVVPVDQSQAGAVPGL